MFKQPASHRKFVARSDQRLWGNQIDYRTSWNVSLNPWTAFRCTALLQCVRALPGRGESASPRMAFDFVGVCASHSDSANRQHLRHGLSEPDGTCIRDYIHIADLVSAHSLALQALDKKEQLIYNLGSGNGYSVREVLNLRKKVTGQPITAIEFARRAGDSARLVASSEKIRHELGWKPKATICKTSSPAPGNGISRIRKDMKNEFFISSHSGWH